MHRKNIVLTGFMGAGKTAVGRELARILQMKLVDIDDEIEKAQKKSISELFAAFGEKYFRDVESETIRLLAEKENLIISTGGGAVLRQENIEALQRNGSVFCLTARPETIYQRTRESTDRPLLRVDDPMAKIRELLEYRRPFYEKAGIMIDTDDKTPLQVAEEIVEIVRCRKPG